MGSCLALKQKVCVSTSKQKNMDDTEIDSDSFYSDTFYSDTFYSVGPAEEEISEGPAEEEISEGPAEEIYVSFKF
jgi:hypothetical protein